jgi:hypothetical protein
MTVKRKKNTRRKTLSIKATKIKGLSKNANKDRKVPHMALLRIEEQQQNLLSAILLTTRPRD